jgi:stage II sporulation protein D
MRGSRLAFSIFALLALCCATVTCAQQTSTHVSNQTSNQASTLRVGLWTLWHDREITVAPTSGGSAGLRLCEQCATMSLAGATKLRADSNAIAFGSRRSASLWLTGSLVLFAHGERISLPYPVHLTARDGVLMMAVTMPVERYVERVVASESGAADSAESLEALAIVVRSFALHVRHGHAEYDLCDATHCQLLHWGATGREAAAHAATLSTAGETLWFHGRRSEAWFHQNCGGHTASPTEVWGAKATPVPSLDGPRLDGPWLVGRADPYCTAHGVKEWSTTLSLEDLTRALATQGLVAPGWKTLAVARRGESGRAVTLMAGATAISAEDFRLAVGRTLGWNKIPSAWFEVTRQGDGFLFHGRGSGHGVGLCQAGAAAMAAQNLDAAAILAQYFPGAEARDEASGLKWQTIARAGYRLQTLDDADRTYLPEIDQELAEARARSGLQSQETITIRAFRSTPAFRSATLAPGWVAAFTEGNWIATQPLRTLAERKMLAPILRHEMLHALVENAAGPKTQLWLREGLVEIWNGRAGSGGELPAAPAPTKMSLDEINRALAHPASEAESQTAHTAAQSHAAALLSRYGRAQVLDWLRNGLPAQISAAQLH